VLCRLLVQQPGPRQEGRGPYRAPSGAALWRTLHAAPISVRRPCTEAPQPGVWARCLAASPEVKRPLKGGKGSFSAPGHCPTHRTTAALLGCQPVALQRCWFWHREGEERQETFCSACDFCPQQKLGRGFVDPGLQTSAPSSKAPSSLTLQRTRPELVISAPRQSPVRRAARLQEAACSQAPPMLRLPG